MPFNIVVEGPRAGPDGDYLRVSPPALELKGLEWMDGNAPDVVVLPQGTTLIKVGLYAARPTDTYCYRVATIGRLVEGRLIPDGDTNAL